MNAGAGSIHQQECGLHGTDIPEAPRVPLLKPSPREKTGAVRASGGTLIHLARTKFHPTKV
jgi:hypothetical protein